MLLSSPSDGSQQPGTPASGERASPSGLGGHRQACGANKDKQAHTREHTGQIVNKKIKQPLSWAWECTPVHLQTQKAERDT